ncbi:electron transport complex subunit RsxC [Succinimonas sp.]|uniref:electron transport complex subunit RsxC n=1 Tax=Succinimonas sp. TaxID=1936151 RepID=UPI0038650054
MNSNWKNILNGVLYSFKGGVYPDEHKSGTSGLQSRALGVPDTLVIPLKQHSGSAAEVLVKPGQHVLQNEPLTSPANDRQVPVHAPVSGTVTAIAQAPIAHAGGLTEPCIILKTDKEPPAGAVYENPAYPSYAEVPVDTLLNHIRSMGIAGLGGAGFPTEAKLRSSVKAQNCELLIINGAECEPYITCDDRLMQENPEDILRGIDILRYILKPRFTVIAIENNKPEAISTLKAKIAETGLQDIRVTEIPVKYPSGAARNLIRIITGIEIPYSARSTAYGVVVHNVSTAFAVGEAVLRGQPLTRRMITVAGDAVKDKMNAWVSLGTPISYILSQCGYQPPPVPRIIVGGPMMGFTVPHTQVPVVKTINCIIAPAANEIKRVKPQVDCIRCGRCAHACPVRLVPYEIYDYCVNGEFKKAYETGLRSCIECGCCSFVCPSAIRIVAAIRIAKAEVKNEKLKEEKLRTARERFEAKKARIEAEEKAREERKAAALARIKAQKAAAETPKAPEPQAAPAAPLSAADKVRLAKEKMAALKAAKAAGAQAAPETAPAKTVKAPEPPKETPAENKAPEKAQALTPEDRIRIAKEKMAALKAAKAAGAQAAPETAPAETVKAPEPPKETPAENKAPEKAQALTPEDRIRIAKEKMAAIKAARAAGASRKDVPENQDRL